MFLVFVSDQPAMTAPSVYERDASGKETLPTDIDTARLKAGTEEMTLRLTEVALTNLGCGAVPPPRNTYGVFACP